LFDRWTNSDIPATLPILFAAFVLEFGVSAAASQHTRILPVCTVQRKDMLNARLTSRAGVCRDGAGGEPGQKKEPQEAALRSLNREASNKATVSLRMSSENPNKHSKHL
jgi:hypothetical protein